MTTSQLCKDQLQRIFENKLANRPEHLERVAVRKVINVPHVDTDYDPTAMQSRDQAAFK